MATTYTTNYNLGKQENHADKFDMDVITDNADKIDAALTGLQSSIDGKQDTLTAAQLAAVNSGITSTDVEQIETNKNNILSIAGKTVGMGEGGTNHITINGQRLYMGATTPTGTIPDNSVGLFGGYMQLYGTDTEQLSSFPALIRANGEPLIDYTIYGNTGGVAARTANLYNWQDGYEAIYPAEDTGIITQSSGSTYSIIVEVEPSTTYTFSIIKQSSGLRRRVGMCANYPQVGDTCLSLDNTTDDSDTRYGNVFTTTSETHYVLIMFYSGSGGSAPDRAKTITVQEGESLDYVPYYQIPVTSGGSTVNLPVTAPLGLTDTLTYTDTGIAIPTFDGDNTISFGTTIQPSGMSAEFKGWHTV